MSWLTASSVGRIDLDSVMATRAQFLWVVLRDGRSIFARCDGVSRQALMRALRSREQTLVLNSPELSLELPVSEVDGYSFFETADELRPQSGLYDLAAI